MKNLIMKAKTGLTNARRKTDRMIITAGTALGATVADALPVWAKGEKAELDASQIGQNFFKYLFQFTTFAGVIMMLAGAVIVIRAMVSMSSGDAHAQGEIGKGIGLFVGGAVAAGMKFVITNIIGIDPTTNDLLSIGD